MPSVASVLEELLLLGPVVPMLRFGEGGHLTHGQALGGFTSYCSRPLPTPAALSSCLHCAHLLLCLAQLQCSVQRSHAQWE